jgi:uncharacterized protein YecT (DUF1311 family)
MSALSCPARSAVSAIAVTVALAAAPAGAGAASFDCARATHPVERALCASDALGRLDERLAGAYAAALEGTADRAPLLRDQRDWNREVRRSCRDDACIGRAWTARIELLERWNDFVPPPADASGRWAQPRTVSVLEGGRWVDRRISDCLELGRRSDGSLEVALNLVRANGHSCGLRGRVVATSGGFEFAPQPGSELEACRLRVRFRSATIVLQDPDDACRQAACGRRAGIDGTEFLLTARGTAACRP